MPRTLHLLAKHAGEPLLLIQGQKSLQHAARLKSQDTQALPHLGKIAHQPQGLAQGKLNRADQRKQVDHQKQHINRSHGQGPAGPPAQYAFHPPIQEIGQYQGDKERQQRAAQERDQQHYGQDHTGQRNKTWIGQQA